jgi:hypothetical protein
MSLAVLLTGLPSSAVAEADTALPSVVPGSSAESVRPGQAPRIRMERSGRFDWPARLRFRDVAETGRSQTLQRWVPPGPWRNAGLVPPSGSGVDAALPVPGEGVVLYRSVESTNRTVVRQWFTGNPDTRTAVIPDPQLGEPWFLRGIGWTQWTQARVAFGMAVDENPQQQVTYLCQRLPDRPTRMEATVEWHPYFNNGDRESAIVMAVCREGGEAAWYLNCVHVRLHRDAVVVDVIQDGRITQALFVAGIVPALEPRVRHHFAVDLAGELIQVHVDGRTLIEGSEPRIDRLAGPAVFWEIFSDAGRRRLSGAIHGLSAEVPGSGSGLSAGSERR